MMVCIFLIMYLWFVFCKMTSVLFKTVYIVTCFAISFILPIKADDDDLIAIIGALQLSLRFYAENYMHMNIDGIFGLRIIEGQMAVIIDELQLSSPTSSRRSFSAVSLKNDSYVLSSVKAMRQQAIQTAHLAKAALQQNDEQYYNLMKPLIHRPWMFAKGFGQAAVDVNLKWRMSSDKNSDSMSEELSDRCMAELMGTLNSSNLCSISSECIAVMSMLGRTGYHITHQLLYGIIAEQFGCLTVLNVRLAPARTSVEKLRSVFCANNFYEVSGMVFGTNGQISSDVQDLFMEQEFVCPNLGYSEFLHSDWLQQILSWQKPSGCWGQSETGKQTQSQLNDLKDGRNGESFQQGALPPPIHQTRKLLYEVSMEGGCLSHKTAVAVAALTQYLRFIMLVDSAGLDAVQLLRGVNYLMNPLNVLRPEPSTTKSEIADWEGRSDLIDDKRKDDIKNRQEEGEEAVRDYQQHQDDFRDNNAEIEINENEEADDTKNSDIRKEDRRNAYDGDDNVILKDRANERGVRVRYHSSSRMLALDAVTSSLTSLYVIMTVLMVLVICLLCRVLRCPLYRRCRLRYL